MKIIVVASLAWSLVNFRGPLLRRLVAAGHDVLAVAPDHDDAVVAELRATGVRFAAIPMDRTGTNPLRDLRTLRALLALLRRERPAAVLAYTQKPIVYAGIAARLAGGIAFHAMVSGLGHAFGEARGLRSRALRAVVSRLYAAALRHAATVFVFNRDDAAEMRRHGIVRRQRVVQVAGSGIDVAAFPERPLPDGSPTFLMIARLMRDKGCGEFVAAARMVRADRPGARFLLLGPRDRNPTSVDAAEIARWQASGDVTYLGETRDVRPALAACHVFVLPSYYREGLPRTILEAMATGRAVITTDRPGCRDPIAEGENGFLVPPRDAVALAGAMRRFVDDPSLAGRMGAAARGIAARDYAVERVNNAILAAIETPGAPPSPGALGDQRWLEAGLAAAALVVAAPLMLAVALVVLVTLGRPILFTQRRAGRGGRPFAMRKFRTMRPLDDAGGHASDAARLTAAGRALRRTRLDELPELIDVLFGRMSFVGPRPLLPETVAAMGAAGRIRGEVRPGLTGWAQVHGNARLSDHDKAALDAWYVRRRSLRLDAAILWRTLTVLLRGERIGHDAIEVAHASLAARRG